MVPKTDSNDFSYNGAWSVDAGSEGVDTLTDIEVVDGGGAGLHHLQRRRLRLDDEHAHPQPAPERHPGLSHWILLRRR